MRDSQNGAAFDLPAHQGQCIIFLWPQDGFLYEIWSYYEYKVIIILLTLVLNISYLIQYKYYIRNHDSWATSFELLGD